MLTDIEIAQSVKARPISEIAAKLGLREEQLIPYGHDKAKVDPAAYQDKPRKGKLILVTAINPTPAGEGKTTTSVGLADGLNKLGKQTCLALREPSLGPVFGVKGGAAGGDTPRSFPWRISTSTSPEISTPSGRPTTCWRLCWTTTSSRGTLWTST